MTEPTRPLRILLVGDASNFNRTLSLGLRRFGHEAVVASDGSRWMRTGRDIDLSRPMPGKLGGLALWLKLKALMASGKLSGYDVVAVISTNFAALKPVRLRKVFDFLTAHNRGVFVTALGTDTEYVRALTSGQPPLRYSEWKVNGQPGPVALSRPGERERWLAPELAGLCEHIYDSSLGTVSALYEYNRVCQGFLPPSRLAYGGIPIDVASIPEVGISPQGQPVRIFLGRHSDRMDEKGTGRLYEAARRVADKHPSLCTLDVVENVPYAEYLDRLQQADIVLDQLYSYTPATNALLAMAMGKVVVSGAEPEYYDFIGERELRPIINAVPDDEQLYSTLEAAVLDRQRLSQLSAQGRPFVLKHNDVEVVARRFLDFWTAKLQSI